MVELEAAKGNALRRADGLRAMDMMTIDVSAPCASCGAEVGFADRTCPGCGIEVSQSVRNALEVRFEASSDELREFKSRAHTATTVLLVLALTHLFVGLLMFCVQMRSSLSPTPAETSSALTTLLINGALGVLLIGCFVWSTRAPGAGLVAALVAWVGVGVLARSTSPPVEVPVASVAAILNTVVSMAMLALVGLVVVALFLRGIAASLRVWLMLRALSQQAR